MPTSLNDLNEDGLPIRTVNINVPVYEHGMGLRYVWEPGFHIESEHFPKDRLFMIRANQAGLISLARHLLQLAQPEVPAGPWGRGPCIGGFLSR